MNNKSIRQEQTDQAISEATDHINHYTTQLSNIAGTPDEELIVDITTQTAKNILFTALQHAPVTNTGSRDADRNLRQAASIAALQAREAAYPAALCNVSTLRLKNIAPEGRGEWMHRNAQALQATGQAVRDSYRGMLMACTAGLGHDDVSRSARRQAVDLAAHVSTVTDTVTNIGTIKGKDADVPNEIHGRGLGIT